jgi:3-oxoacyl-[acyl-carrier-protein] synthase II
VAAFLGLRGPVAMIPTACAAGNFAIGLGRDLILRGDADLVLAGGVDPYSRVAHTGFNRLLSMSPDVCRPFDLRRKGIVLGEGAGVLVLERESAARARGATPLAAVLGYGLSNDAFHIVNPDPDGLGLLRAMEAAMADAGLTAADIDYVSAHGTGTPANDAAESRAIRAFLGPRHRSVPVSSIKSMIGHTMGAASALEAVACVMALVSGIVPPTANHEVPDPECDLDVVPNQARRHPVGVVLSNAMAFGGNNACLVLGRG